MECPIGQIPPAKVHPDRRGWEKRGLVEVPTHPGLGYGVSGRGAGARSVREQPCPVELFGREGKASWRKIVSKECNAGGCQIVMILEVVLSRVVPYPRMAFRFKGLSRSELQTAERNATLTWDKKAYHIPHLASCMYKKD